MAHKSKTQRAKATVAKANRKDREQRDEVQRANEALAKAAEPPKKTSFFKKSEEKPEAKAEAKPAKSQAIEKKPKKQRFKFIKEVRAEMKRVTWPTRQDVLRWSGVVVGALLFFGIFTAVLDNVIITPLLVALSNLGA